MIIIDHYAIDYKYEKKLKKANKQLRILSFDDTYEKHYCDILLNHNINANSKKYKDLVPQYCKLRCGSQYTLLRDEFIKEKKKRKKLLQTKYSTTNILVAMGGADTANLNISILKVLNKYNNITVTIVTTSSNNNLATLKNYCKNKRWINLQINSTMIAKLMRKSDFGIITPSVTANEMYFMQIPFIAIKTANNQKEMYKFLKKQNYLTIKKFNRYILNFFIKKLLKRIYL
jgi:UDP-2,4-diacetamido-2,4,6-trideoxy-beta-L-altropyranose hydrolase